METEQDRIVAAAAALDTERFRMPSSLEGVGETGIDSGDVSMDEPVASGQKVSQRTPQVLYAFKGLAQYIVFT